jgi:hypothetical protein
MKFSFDIPVRYNLAFVLILFTALLLRTATLNEYYFLSDYDEYFTVKTVMGIYESKFESGRCITPENLMANDAQQLLHDSMRDFGNNTLYNFILGVYIRVVGFNDIKLRYFSVLFGILAIALIHPIGREMKAKNHQILTAMALLAFNPILIQYSEIIRAYSWCVFLALLFFLFNLRAIKQPKLIFNWVFIGLLGLAMFLSHYLMVYVIGTSFLFLAYHFRKTIWQQYAMLLSYSIVGFCAVLFVASNPQFIQSVESKNSSLQKQASLSNESQKTRKIESLSLKSFATGGVSYLNQYYCYSRLPMGIARSVAGNIGMWILGAILLVLPGILIYSIASNTPQPQIALALWMCAAANIMVFLLVLYSKHDTSFSIKYTIFTLPFYLIAIAFQRTRKRYAAIAFAATAIISFSSGINGIVNHYEKPIAIDVDHIKHQILPTNRNELMALIPFLDSPPDNCVQVHSKQEVIFLALVNPNWMRINMCITEDSTPANSCESLNFRFVLLH